MPVKWSRNGYYPSCWLVAVAHREKSSVISTLMDMYEPTHWIISYVIMRLPFSLVLKKIIFFAWTWLIQNLYEKFRFGLDLQQLNFYYSCLDVQIVSQNCIQGPKRIKLYIALPTKYMCDANEISSKGRSWFWSWETTCIFLDNWHDDWVLGTIYNRHNKELEAAMKRLVL